MMPASRDRGSAQMFDPSKPLQIKPITSICTDYPDASATYHRGATVVQLLLSHDLRRQDCGRPVHRYSFEQVLAKAFRYFLQGVTEQGEATRLAYYQAVFGDFWRNTYDRRFPGWILPRQAQKNLKATIRAEAETWIAALDCLLALNQKGVWVFEWPHCHPGKTLVSLIAEAHLLAWCVDYENQRSANALRIHQQSINAALQRRENPFEAGTVAHQFVDLCLPHLEYYPRLEQAWDRLITSRSKLLQHWRGEQPTPYHIDRWDIADPKLAIAAKKERSRKYSRKNSK